MTTDAAGIWKLMADSYSAQASTKFAQQFSHVRPTRVASASMSHVGSAAFCVTMRSPRNVVSVASPPMLASAA
jgi:hypothetical protein